MFFQAASVTHFWYKLEFGLGRSQIILSSFIIMYTIKLIFDYYLLVYSIFE